MQITAGMVKELRERSGAGMMECKKALTEVGGDVETAIEHLRKQGLAKADKKSGRVAAEGRIAMAQDGAQAVLVEVNCETDFVAKDDNFVSFCDAAASAALAAGVDTVEGMNDLDLSGQTLEAARLALVAKIGENIQVRRIVKVASPGALGAYLHGSRIGVLVSLEGGSEDLARDLAMHVAATKPAFLDAKAVPADVLEKETEILKAQVAESGKPPEIVEKMVEGRVRKYLAEISLVEQQFVKDPDVKVRDLLKKAGASVKGFVRYEVGEGIDKGGDDFATEVAKQLG